MTTRGSSCVDENVGQAGVGERPGEVVAGALEVCQAFEVCRDHTAGAQRPGHPGGLRVVEGHELSVKHRLVADATQEQYRRADRRIPVSDLLDIVERRVVAADVDAGVAWGGEHEPDDITRDGSLPSGPWRAGRPVMVTSVPSGAVSAACSQNASPFALPPRRPAPETVV